MKTKVFSILILVFVLSCDRYPDPSVKSLREYSFTFFNENGNRHFAGDWVSDSIRFRAINNLDPFKDPIRVVFEVVKGGGEITKTEGSTDTNGFVYTGWKLGSESFEQILRANSYDSDGNFLTSTSLMAYGFRSDEWDKLSDASEYGISDMASDTINNVTLAIMNGRIFKQGEHYYLWNELFTSINESVISIEIDNNQIFYVLSWNGNLFRSANQGESWIKCSKPYSQINFSANLKISGDNYIWVSGYPNQVKYSKDGGITWTGVIEDVSKHGLGDVFRLKDGSLMLHGSDCCYMFRSFDDGLTWTRITTPGYSLKLYADENDAIYIVTQEGGMAFYKSTDYGLTYSFVHRVNPPWSSSMENTFNKYGSFYYIFIQGYGILKSKDLINYEIYWQNQDLGYFFIDQSGVLICKNWTSQSPYSRVVYYRKNSVK
jgi:hypothetical protein